MDRQIKVREIIVFAEQRDGRIHPVVFEILGKGRELAERIKAEVSAVLLGNDIRDKAKELIYHGADKVYLYDSPRLKEFDVIQYKHNIVKLLKEIEPDILLLGATNFGRVLGPRIASALRTGLTADCTGLELDDDGNLIQIRPAFTGNILAWIKTRTRPVMSTVRYRVMSAMEKDEKREGLIIRKEPEILPETGIKPLGKESASKISISEAEIIVSGGRGLKGPEGFRLIEELAEALGGVVGSSRIPVDEGWIGKEHQVGFSGNIVKPKLYVACGISGSPQHLAGMRDSEIIIAINNDPSAPIFRVADYGIVGDLYEVIPKLISKIKEVTRGVSHD
ncbi:MAG: electron transfer flavoprotein subunit alpha/FixB family protein [Thermoproteota archaeon]